MESRIIKPFGPPVYFSKLTQEELDLFKLLADQTKKENNSMANKLAGNIDSQLELFIASKEQHNQFIEIISPHINECIFGFDERKTFFQSPSSNLLKFNLGNGPWINFQRQYEFNPIHSHSGLISVVIYIDVPEEIEKERLDQKNTNKPAAGNIDFIYGENHHFITGLNSITPTTGDIIMFPAYLKHQVYPFKSAVERISMAFNIYDISIDDETAQ